MKQYYNHNQERLQVEKGGFPNIDSIVRVRCTADDTILYECKNGEVIFDHTH